MISIIIYCCFILFSKAIEYGEILPFSCVVYFNNGTWGNPSMVNDTGGRIDYSSRGMQFAQNVLDSLRWYKGYDGKYRIYRPNYKLEHFNYGSKYLDLPEIPAKIFYSCLKLYLESAEYYNPDPKKNESIYVRTFYLQTGNNMVGFDTNTAQMVLTGYIATNLFANTKRSIIVCVETERVKNFDGSLAWVKTAANYGPINLVDKRASDRGCDTALWLYARKCKRKCLSELSGGNLFIVLKERGRRYRTVVTIRDKYIAFPGSIRNATIQLFTKILNLKVKIGCIFVDQLQSLVQKGILLEMFTTGHYVQVTPITEVKYGNLSIPIPTLNQQNAVYMEIRNRLQGYNYGTLTNEYQWMYCVSEKNNVLQPC